jgi:D-xylose 1-dehydrogenase (NADP+, D-xylono-1,5-lactone-forming)
MTDKIRWGVLGNATVARTCVIPAIQKSRNGLVHALATRRPEIADLLAAENHIERIYDRYEALLEDPAIDAVYIPLPNHLHLPWTLRALSAGKHVLCEKPIACTAQEAHEMADAVGRGNLFLMEAFMYRFHPRSRQIKQWVSEGRIGEPRLVRSAFCFHMAQEILEAGDNVRLRAGMGGGALLDVGCYSVSVARWMMGAEPTQVQAQAIYHDTGVDVHVVGTLQFPGGGLATLEASFISALQQTFSVVGTGGAIDLPHDAFIPWQKNAEYILRGQDQETGCKHVVPGADEYQLMVEHFSDAVLGNAKLDFLFKDSIANMKVLDALMQAALSGNTVKL